MFSLDRGWRFHLGNAANPDKDFGFGGHHRKGAFGDASFTAPAGEPKFDVSDWRIVDLPHDWAVELPYLNTPENAAKGSKPVGRFYPETSIGWYRREFNIPACDQRARFILDFEGVFRDAIFILNGHYLGRNFSGYAPWHSDISSYLNYGANNILVVRVDATLAEGWFYEGAGIYRHVTLTRTPALHVAHDGIYIRSRVHGSEARVLIETQVDNDQDVPAGGSLCHEVLDADDRTIATSTSNPFQVKPWETVKLEVQIPVSKAQLWSVDRPYLYRLRTTILAGAQSGDQQEIPFGIRTIHFDSERGLLLNGKYVKVKGTCNHQDHGGVGTAVPDALQEERVERLHEMGSNACRTAHGPVAPAFLNACDRQGMLVLAETRMMASTNEGLSQLERMILRDRNHPSIFLWSLSNEEPDQGSERGARIEAAMKRLVRKLDPDRLVTAAMNNSWGRGVSAVVDVQGFNYAGGGQGIDTGKNIDAFHSNFPDKPVVATETASVFNTRGTYVNNPALGLVSAYDLNFPDYTMSAEDWWQVQAEREFLAGGFAWTGFDYRGEPVPYTDVSVGSQFGIMDSCGFPKDNYFYYKSWWSSRDVLHLFPHWNWQGQEGQPIEVWCYSNLDAVELLLNGKSLGRRSMPRNGHLQWSVPWVAGVLEARGYRNDQVILMQKRETTGPATQLVLKPRKSLMAADGEDVCSVAVEVQDAQGRIVPDAASMIRFRLSGPGKIIGLGNGDPNTREADKPANTALGERSAFRGLAMIWIQSGLETGTLQVKATSDSMMSATALLQLSAAQPKLVQA